LTATAFAAEGAGDGDEADFALMAISLS